MSIQHCFDCDKDIDLDFNSEHFDWSRPYICKICKEEWETSCCESSYSDDYPEYLKICPFCEMPIIQLISDIWREDKIKGVPHIIKIIGCRLLRK